jgi:hypothetical protein
MLKRVTFQTNVSFGCGGRQCPGETLAGTGQRGRPAAPGAAIYDHTDRVTGGARRPVTGRLAGVAADEVARVVEAEAVGAAVFLHDVGDRAVGLAAGPVPLQFE